jgi:hypothetical protein
MRKKIFERGLLIGLVCFSLAGCETIPKGFLKLEEASLQKRNLQTRQYETRDETQIIAATAGVLQDIGFTLDDSETELGLVVASKSADATDAGQIAGAFLIDMLGALGGSYSNASSQVDAVQNVKACVIVKPNGTGDKILVRINLQRIVWNVSNQINRVETLNDPVLYENFFEKLSKAIFLEAHQI